MERQEIRGDTRLVALLGDPVAHSVSPLIHNHLFARLGLPFVYIPLRVAAADLGAAVRVLRSARCAGANITIPHKQAAAPLCDRLSDLSKMTGTVNTLWFAEECLHGTTTDADGFFGALAWMGHDPAGGRVVILGNGGAARTLSFALALAKKCAAIALVGRDDTRVGSLAAEVGDRTGFAVAHATFGTKAAAQALAACTLLVNCTSVGMHPAADASPVDSAVLHAGMTVFDTIYNPAKTRLVAAAERAGCRVQNGLRMLLYQGLSSFALWTGMRPDESLVDVNELTRAMGRA